MRKKLATKVLLTLACLCLLAGTLYAAPPPGCWYNGSVTYHEYTVCNYCYVLNGNAVYPDGRLQDVYFGYTCPGGSTGWDFIETNVLYCFYRSLCNHM